MAAEDEGPIKLEDSNMANYGGEDHRKRMKDAALKQKEWKGLVGSDEERVKVWRIEKFKVKEWGEKLKGKPETGKFGEFFDGDSFIIMNAYKGVTDDGETEKEQMLYNIHFWLGQNTSQDEMGAAAIKTVELDDLLDDLPVQYREVEGIESKTFKALFENLKVNAGGIESGFRHVKPEEYKPRLFHCHGTKKRIGMQEVPCKSSELNSGDVFVLDNGLMLYRFDGDKARGLEKRKATKAIDKIKDERNGRPKSKIIDFEDDDADAKQFWEVLGGKPEKLSDSQGFMSREKAKEEEFMNHENVAIHVTNETDNPEETGEMRFIEKARGVLDKSLLEDEDMHDDVVIIDVGRVIFVWLGQKCNKEESSQAMITAQKYLMKSGRALKATVVRVMHGKEPENFWKCFGCEHVDAGIV